MELDQFKSAWQNRPVDDSSLVAAAPSRALRFLRTSTIHDLQKARDLSRVFLNSLFALLLIGVSIKVMITGSGRVAAWLFAAALIIDGIVSLRLLMRRFPKPANATMSEFILREHRGLESRVRFERYSRWLMYALGTIALTVLLFGPHPASVKDSALDAFSRMALGTAFLAVAWRRARSRSIETQRELDRYVKELQS